MERMLAFADFGEACVALLYLFGTILLGRFVVMKEILAWIGVLSLT